MTKVVALSATALIAFALASIVHAQNYTWSLLAGAPPQFGAADGPAANARFKMPTAVVCDASGTLYVSDTSNHTIRKIAPDGSAITLAGKAQEPGSADGSGESARFNFPEGLALDRSGNLYVADRSNHTVRKITPTGNVTTFAGRVGAIGTADGPVSDARFCFPYGLAFDPDENLIVTDSGNHSIRLITPAGIVGTIAGSSGTAGHTNGIGQAARFFSPTGVTLDRAGNIFVADSSNETIRRISRDRTVSTFAGSAGTYGSADGAGAAARFSKPAALAIDASDNVYVADTHNDCIRKITPDGAVSVFAGRRDARGSANGHGSVAQFFTPYGITVSRDGSFYIADTRNHTIRKIAAGNIVSNHSGPGGNFGYVDAVGADARFNYPKGIALDFDRLYITDARNNQVRQVTMAGGVTSVLTGVHTGIAYGSDMLVLSDVGTDTVRVFLLSTGRVVDLTRFSTSGANIFNEPNGVAIDRQGRIYVADTGNHTIRVIIIKPTETLINTVAGREGIAGAADGLGAAALFNLPMAVAVDDADNIYVADTGSHTIRRISAQGVVTTLAGTADIRGLVDGSGAAARFNTPAGIALDKAGSIYVADSGNNGVRRITTSGVVSTIGGSGSTGIYAEGNGAQAQFSEPTGITVDAEGVVYVVSSSANVIMKGVLDRLPVIASAPQGAVTTAGTTVTLAVTASGTGLYYQWSVDGVAIAGANASTLTIANATPAHSGRYTVRVSNSAGNITSAPAEVTVQNGRPAMSRIINLAIRSRAGSDAQTLIVGIGVGGAGTSGTKPILFRAIGPTLSEFGVENALSDPRLALFAASGKIRENDNWFEDSSVSAVSERVGAFELKSASSCDAALFLPSLALGTYSVQVTGTTGGALSTGIALAEVYDATPHASATTLSPRLINVSARTQVGVGGDILIAGFVISGEVGKSVLIRGIGPTLNGFAVEDALLDPKLELFDATGKIAENDDWGGDPLLAATARAVGAFALDSSTRDAALLITLPPGNYTVQVSGVNQTSGVGMVEIYEVP